MGRNGQVMELFEDYREFCKTAAEAMKPVASLRERAVVLIATSKKRQREIQCEMKEAYGGRSKPTNRAFEKARLALVAEQERALALGLILDRTGQNVSHFVGDGRRMAELLSGEK